MEVKEAGTEDSEAGKRILELAARYKGLRHPNRREAPAFKAELKAIEEGAAAYGMQSFDQSLMELLNKELITYDEALLHCTRPEDFRIRYEGISAMDGKKWSDDGNFDRKNNDKWQNVTEVEIILPTEIKKIRKSGSGGKS